MSQPTGHDAPWIDDDEPPPAELVNAWGRSRIVLACDHASPRIPRRLGTLGLSPEDRRRHVAWDIGAAALARRLAGILDAPLVLSGYSRLVVDCNRPLHARDAFATESEDVAVPGNRSLTPGHRAGRADAFFWPYHDCLHRLVGARAADGHVPFLLSVHSFTPVYRGRPRPWHVGALHRWDDRGARLVLQALGRDDNLHLGDNQPYRLALDEDFTIPVHAERRGLPHVLLEIRQDLIATEAGVRSWADRLGRLFADLLGDERLDRHGSVAPDVRAPRFE